MFEDIFLVFMYYKNILESINDSQTFYTNKLRSTWRPNEWTTKGPFLLNAVIVPCPETKGSWQLVIVTE